MDDRVGSEYWGTPEFEEYVSHFTDLTESMGYKTLFETLRNKHADESPEEILQAVSDGIGSFAGGATQSDDITMLAIRYKGR